jgi:hypothetical protein
MGAKQLNTHRASFQDRQQGPDVAAEAFRGFMSAMGVRAHKVGPDPKDDLLPDFHLWPPSLWTPDYYLKRGDNRPVFVEVKGTRTIKEYDFVCMEDFWNRLAYADGRIGFVVAINPHPSTHPDDFTLLKYLDFRHKFFDGEPGEYEGECGRDGKPKRYRVIEL